MTGDGGRCPVTGPEVTGESVQTEVVISPA